MALYVIKAMSIAKLEAIANCTRHHIGELQAFMLPAIARECR
jgi:hypothetical protein